ncbi:MAG: hypothetical protein ACTMIR_06595 [Cellulomonadaceae bacterium]
MSRKIPVVVITRSWSECVDSTGFDAHPASSTDTHASNATARAIRPLRRFIALRPTRG